MNFLVAVFGFCLGEFLVVELVVDSGNMLGVFGCELGNFSRWDGFSSSLFLGSFRQFFSGFCALNYVPPVLNKSCVVLIFFGCWAVGQFR